MKHFIQDYAQPPDIYFVIIGDVVDHLGSHVLAGSAARVSLEFELGSAPAEVTELDVKVLIEQ